MVNNFYPDPRAGKFALVVDADGILWRENWETPSELTRIVDSAVYHPGTGSLLSIFWHLPVFEGGDNERSTNVVSDLHEGNAG
jgi:hypothetical protein